ncbi:Cyclic AMP-responsive element-binding protein 3-like protein 3-B [Channa argus]|uniref:Cyclic AMP-responsive element-binding protein 3-like protein 3-B n=1 Tax=Channa argus TaxID=215402 RepID=A0A6G1QA77_CHAAH|nr:Cyclic AMP-responsive element-binding protein 3-like protein 3-B [Channa argus]KAK2895399.1 hypothetical protein Q8A73_014887 [Channa argus]
MTLTTDKVHGGMDLIDLLLSNAEETTGCHSSTPWAFTIRDTLGPEGSPANDFLDALLAGRDTSSAPTSPLWSPCTTESDVTEEHLTDPIDRPYSPFSMAFPAFDTQTSLQPPPLLPLDEKISNVSIDLGWESNDIREQFGIAYYLAANQGSSLLSSQALTVKDLLLSNLGEKSQGFPQDCLQELVLNEDEKKLLTKEGVNLPSKMPLSKFEEKVLKKIRRKIRNKRSAQESRRKKREYVDSLEGRMSACSAHNLELQRKIQQLEETNSALLDQLSRLQALLPNSSSKTTHKGTCILVFLLSFSLLISSNLHPNPHSLLNHGEYTETKVPSRSLLLMDEVQEVSPPSCVLLSISRGFENLCSLMEKNIRTVDLSFTHHTAHKHQDQH